MEDIYYYNRLQKLVKGYNAEGTQEVSIDYNNSTNQFLFKNVDGTYKTLNNTTVQLGDLQFYNPTMRLELASEYGEPAYPANSVLKTFIKYDATFLTDNDYSVIDEVINSVSICLTKNGTFTKPNRQFNFFNVKMVLIDSDDELYEDWSGLTASSINSQILAAEGFFEQSFIITPEDENFFSFDGKDFYRFNVPTFVISSNKALIVYFDLATPVGRTFDLGVWPTTRTMMVKDTISGGTNTKINEYNAALLFNV